MCNEIILQNKHYTPEKLNMDKNKLDFVTICFNHELELNLMKLQAFSFKYVEPKMISNIIIFYNDTGVNKLEFIKQYYPVILQSKVTIIYRDNVIDKRQGSTWKNQQFFKLFISNYIKSKYNIMLDCKNHFIRKTTLADFIKNDKPKLFLGQPGDMIKYYKNCLSYFEIKDPFDYEYNKEGTQATGTNVLMTTTPYVFITEQVINLINYVKNRENKTFYDFFEKRKSITEFYLYSTYLIYTDTINKHEYDSQNNMVVTIYDDPTVEWNDYHHKKSAITNSYVKVFGLHRLSVERMDADYKQNLLNLYSNFFDEKILKFISLAILNKGS